MLREYPYNCHMIQIERGPSKEELFRSLASAVHDRENNIVVFELKDGRKTTVRITELRQADEDGIQYHFVAAVDGGYRPCRGFYDTSRRDIGWIEVSGV